MLTGKSISRRAPLQVSGTEGEGPPHLEICPLVPSSRNFTGYSSVKEKCEWAGKVRQVNSIEVVDWTYRIADSKMELFHLGNVEERKCKKQP